MSNFDTAIQYVLLNEGGFVDNENDPGSATNFGISLSFLKRISEATLRRYGIYKSGEELNSDDIQALTRDQAISIYKDNFWDAAKLDEIASLEVSTYILDIIVSHGLSEGIKFVQRAVCACHKKIGVVVDDGVCGPVTISAINCVILDEELVAVLIATRVMYYISLTELHPTQKEFLNGWIARAYKIGSLLNINE